MKQSEQTVRDESFALGISAGGTLLIAMTSFGFAVWTRSSVILLDGVFFLIVFVMSLMTLAVFRIIQRPEDDKFHFGYAKFEPLINIIKALIITIVCVFALVGAIDAFLHGGNQMNAGPAIAYTVILTAACVVMTAVLRHYARKCRSTLLEVDAKNWLIDSLIGMGLMGGFGLVYFLEQAGWTRYLHYADPTLLTLLILISLPIPVRILRDNISEIMDMAPDKVLQDDLRRLIEDALVDEEIEELHLRILKTGRVLYVLIHIHLDPEYPLESVSILDAIREKINASIQTKIAGAVIDVCFIGDLK